MREFDRGLRAKVLLRASPTTISRSGSIASVMTRMGAQGLLGPTLPHDYGGAGLGYVAYGLAAPRDRAHRQRLSIDDERAVLARDACDLRLRQRGAAPQISAKARDRRMDRLLRPHRARRRIRPARHAHKGGKNHGRLSAHRHQDLDHQQPDRRYRRGLGDDRRPTTNAIRGFILERGMQGLHHARDHARSCRCAPRPPARS